MRYLVAAEGSTLSAPVSKRFGHAAFHLVVDSDRQEILEALERNHDLPGHGVERFLKWNLEGVITGNVGPAAFRDLKARHLSIYIVRATTVQKAVFQVANGEIEAADGPTMKHSVHTHGSGNGGEHHHHSGHGHGQM
ncbi:MAG: NifB/NifX family molybdenum-iron cluster-binding protein [bacterium]